MSGSRAIQGLVAAALSGCLTIVAMAALPGCGGNPEFDQAVAHTPESLVEEFMIRYKNLPGQANAKQRERALKAAEAQAKLPEVDAGLKASRKGAEAKRQMLAETQTLDNILDALDRRLGSVKGLSRREAVAKAAELLQKEPDLREEDRKVIVERLSK